MAARSQPSEPPRRLRLVVAGLIALSPLALPAVAQAHGTSAVNALDFEARVTSTGRDPGGIHATVLDGDRRLELRVAGSHTVVVLGYAGEPYLRFSPQGVAVNERSPTALANKLTASGATPALDPVATPSWTLLAVTERYAWHDHRLGPKPGLAYGRGVVAAWAIPVVIDGRRDRVAGQLWHAEGPPLWPWLALLGLALATAAVLARQRRVAVSRAALVFAGIAGVAAEVLSVGLSFGPGVPLSTAWVDVPSALAIAAVAIVFFVRVPLGREAIAGLVGLVAALVGLGDADVLLHGYVISTVPAAAIRSAAAVAVSAGLIAAVVAAARFLATDRPPAAAARPAMATPRGKARSR